MNGLDTTKIVWIAVAAALALGLWLGMANPAAPLMKEPSSSAEADYRQTVMAILQGERSESIGLTPLLEELFKAMYCPENACVYASEMAYLLRINEEAMSTYRSEFITPICQSDDLTPPERLRPDHRTLCDVLEAIFSHMRAIQQNTEIAQSLLARTEQDNVESIRTVLGNLNDRILTSRDRIVAELERLEAISWLAPTVEQATSRLNDAIQTPSGTGSSEGSDGTE